MNDQGPSHHDIRFGKPSLGNARDTSITTEGKVLTILFDRLGALSEAGRPSASHAAEITIPVDSASDNAEVLIEMRGYAGSSPDADVLLIVHDGRSEQSLRFDGDGGFYFGWHRPVSTGVPLRISLLAAVRAGSTPASGALVVIDSLDVSPTLRAETASGKTARMASMR